ELAALADDARLQAVHLLFEVLAPQRPGVPLVAQRPLGVGQGEFAALQGAGAERQVGVLSLALTAPLPLCMPQLVPFLLKLPFTQLHVAAGAEAGLDHRLPLLAQDPSP